ncbi:hypothetical protein EYB53_018135 [Candidatus Chloroploca sp. M-50]|uniref:Uncharacterized protein n=1 Tax=Candidatus Chloroploca mongolica TaxID=2528176 RepID=A0ABS4DE69_9CHLR|nr:hypothetical protein [Candidatus Chloroploca mongolica]MBP1467639.1 hypothetical protein [Candidatus Chloroploca mongolica]
MTAELVYLQNQLNALDAAIDAVKTDAERTRYATVQIDGVSDELTRLAMASARNALAERFDRQRRSLESDRLRVAQQYARAKQNLADARANLARLEAVAERDAQIARELNAAIPHLQVAASLWPVGRENRTAAELAQRAKAEAERYALTAANIAHHRNQIERLSEGWNED